MIDVESLTRIFRTYKKQPGFWGGVKGLFRREFEEIRAADNISFTIAEGEFVGFLGPNGAGKTTTLKMLSGLIYPTSGRARVAGFDPTRRENAYRRIFALVLGQKNQLWWDLPAIESFLLLRHIYGLDATQYKQTLDELVSLLDVGHKLNVMVRELAWRADEDGTHRRAAAPPARPLSRRAHHRPGCGLPKGRALVPARLQPALSHHDSPHQPLHGRYQGAVRARHRHPQGPEDP